MDSSERRELFNRELSWLGFNSRVLEEAKQPSLPLYERLKFLSIVSANLDEFFMVRVAGLKQQIATGVLQAPADGMPPSEQLNAIADRTHEMVADQYRVFEEEVRPALATQGVHLLAPSEMNVEQRQAARAHYQSSVFPALTPLAVDPGHPFPHLKNKSLNIAVFLRREGRRRRGAIRDLSLAVVQVPAVLGRVVPLPSSDGRAAILMESLIAAYFGDLFPGYTVVDTAVFRVTRNWDLAVDEEESEDLLSTIQEELRRRDRGSAVRLEIAAGAPAELVRSLSSFLNLSASDVYPISGPIQINDLLALSEPDSRAELRVEAHSPVVSPELRDADSIADVIAKHDLLLHHPFESFDPVVRFISEAAEDPAVLAIKQTLYRTSGDSPLVRALFRAADNGKQATVLVEIKARFDEANNIAWARRLEENGVHVVYGLIGLKTHCKVSIVVRREPQGIRRYVHLGTGNYNPQTARQYTDLSLFTARSEVADDVTALFNMLTGYAEVPLWKKLVVAPFGLQERIIELINDQAKAASRGEPARIIAKMNALVDPGVIRALYAASQAGVNIDLIVRSICCLRPGVPGMSERIRVISIVDRFLEHSRVFAFGAGSDAKVFLSSADWMPRNFVRRVEVMFPVDDPGLRARVLNEVLGLALRDNVKAHLLQPDGSYSRVPSLEPVVRCQSELIDLARTSVAPKALEPLIRQAAAPVIPDGSLRPIPAAAG